MTLLTSKLMSLAVKGSSSTSSGGSSFNWRDWKSEVTVKGYNTKCTNCYEIFTVRTIDYQSSSNNKDYLPLSLPKANLSKPRKLLNPELPNKTLRCDHSNECSRWVGCCWTEFMFLQIMFNLNIETWHWKGSYTRTNCVKWVKFSSTYSLSQTFSSHQNVLEGGRGGA